MEAFNIKINVTQKEVTVTILPIATNSYKIIFDGGILGGINFTEGSYQFIEPEDLEPGDLPLYAYKQGESIEDPLDLNEAMKKQIAVKIFELADSKIS